MTSTHSTGAEPILLAFSGGLDTSFCVPWLKDTYGRPVITVTVDTGGIDAAPRALAERSQALGAIEHHLIDARANYFDQVLKFLIMGNVRRGQLYPLCVGAERVLQAQTIAQMALSLGRMVAHGCTAAGNDQVRFEVALRTWRRNSRSSRRCATARSSAGTAEVSARPPIADPAVRRRLLGESRPLGRDDRRQGNADLGRQHSRERLGALEAMPSRAAHPSATRSASNAAFRRASTALRSRRSRSSRRSRGSRVRSASAAAFIWATR
jgi:hypothetical protein